MFICVWVVVDVLFLWFTSVLSAFVIVVVFRRLSMIVFLCVRVYVSWLLQGVFKDVVV